MVDELQLITGIDVPVPELGFTLKQPRVKEIAIIGEDNYFMALSLFLIKKEMLGIKEDMSEWEIFRQVLQQKIDDNVNLTSLISNFLQLFVLGKIIIGPRSLIIQTGDETVNIEPNQFGQFKELIGQVGGGSLLVTNEETFKPKNKRASEIAEKMKKARKRLAAQQPQAKSKGFLGRYVKAVATVTANSLQDITEMTLLQLTGLMEAYLAWEEYDLEIKNRLAGAKGEDKLQHWTMKFDRDTKENSSIGII